MRVFFDEIHDNYDILNLSYEDLTELKNVLDSCQLPQKRKFYALKTNVEKFIAMKAKLPTKRTTIKHGT